MNPANRAFYSLVALSLLAAAGLGAASAQLLLPHADAVGSALHGIAHWCHLLVTGSAGADEIVLLGLLGLLPVASLRGLGSLVRQWRATRRFVRTKTARPVQRLPERLVRLSDRLGLTDRIAVVRAPRPYSFCYGLLRPRICLSTALVGILTEAELEAVLLHEHFHLKNRDPLKHLLSRALERAFFFLPIVAELGHHYRVAAELAADRAVIERQGQRRPLASALYKVLTATDAADSGPGLAGPAGVTHLRIAHLLHPHTPERLRLSLSALATSLLVLLLIATVVLFPGLVGADPHLHVLDAHAPAACLL